MYKIIKSILNGTCNVGYQVEDKNGNVYNLTKADTIRLAYNHKIINSYYNKYTQSISGYGCDLRKLGSIQLNNIHK